MPAILCHWLFGEKMLPLLTEQSMERSILADMDRSCFMWGCQGPDILFYSRLYPWMIGPDYRRFGTPLHDDHAVGVMRTLLSMLASYTGDDRRRMLGYCAGMCCHYSLDRVTHPFIYWLEDKMRSSDRRGKDYHYHGEIESMLDIIMLRRERGMLPCDVNLCESLPDDINAAGLIAYIYANVLEKLCRVKPDMKTLRLLASDTRAAFMLLNDPYAIKRPLISAVEKLVGGKGWITAFMRTLTEDLNYDYANYCHREWFMPQQPSRHGREDFAELYDRAADDALYITECFLKAADGNGEIGEYMEGINFSGSSI